MHHPSGARCLARFLVFVVRGDRRALGAALATVLVGYAAAVWALGASTIFDYLTRVLPLVTRLYRASDGNISAWTVGWRVFGGTRSEVLAGVSAPPLVQSAQAAAVVSVVLPVLILLASLISIRKQRSEGIAIGLMICVSVLVSPISWGHYLILATIPAVEVGSWLIRHHLPPRYTNAALLVAMLLLPGNEWTTLALTIAGNTAMPDGTVQIPFASALLTMGPAVAVAALAVLLVALPDSPTESPKREGAVQGGD